MKGQYAKAEPVLLDARNTRARVLGKENADYANSCNILGIVYVETGLYEETKALNAMKNKYRNDPYKWAV